MVCSDIDLWPLASASLSFFTKPGGACCFACCKKVVKHVTCTFAFYLHSTCLSHAAPQAAGGGASGRSCFCWGWIDNFLPHKHTSQNKKEKKYYYGSIKYICGIIIIIIITTSCHWWSCSDKCKCGERGDGRRCSSCFCLNPALTTTYTQSPGDPRAELVFPISLSCLLLWDVATLLNCQAGVTSVWKKLLRCAGKPNPSKVFHLTLWKIKDLDFKVWLCASQAADFRWNTCEQKFNVFQTAQLSWLDPPLLLKQFLGHKLSWKK